MTSPRERRDAQSDEDARRRCRVLPHRHHVPGRHDWVRWEAVDLRLVEKQEERAGSADTVARVVAVQPSLRHPRFDQLVDPAAGQAFHVIAPSLPGYAFSTPLSATGWAMGRTARAWAELMRRLGYERYGVHGGDIGAGVSGMVAGLDGDHVIGMHVVTDPLTAAATATFIPGMGGRLDEDDPVDKLILERMDAFSRDGSGYLAIQNSRPQTIGYGLADSPLLQLAWIAEKVHEWTDLPIDRDQLLTTVSLYWFTGSGATAAHTLYEQAHSSDWGPPPAVPQGFAVFGADETVRKLVPAPPGAHWTEFPRGRHFPAMEAPAQLAADLRAFFGPLR